MTTEKERLFRVLGGQEVDRPPVIIPGGGMNGILVEVMEESGYSWPKAHTDPEFMSGLAAATKEMTGLENVGVPFCLTVEAEALGSRVDYNSAKTEPRITEYAASEWGGGAWYKNPDDEQKRRMAVVLNAISQLKASAGDAPVLSNVTGPMSVATSVVDPISVFKMVRLDPEGLGQLLDISLDFSINFVKKQIAQGADVVVIADPTATGEIIGAKAFGAFEVPRLQKLVSVAHDEGARVIVHICGNIKSILEHVKLLGADALSFDSIVNIGNVRAAVGDLPLMGNISTNLLHQGTPAQVEASVRDVVKAGINIVSPACGLSPITPLANIQAMCRTVKDLVIA